MLADLQALGRTLTLPPIEVVDVDGLLLDGTPVCRHRLDVAELARLLRPRTPSV
jgi:hypothetical protein